MTFNGTDLCFFFCCIGTFPRFFKYSFLIIFFHLLLFDCVSFQYSQVLVRFLFTECFNFFLDLVLPFHPSCVVFRFSLLAWHIFLCQILSLCPVCRFFLCILDFKFFSIFENSLILSKYMKWLIVSRDLSSLYPAEHFQRMLLSGIIAITNSNGDSANPRNIPLWIFASA